jgi:integrase
MRTQATFGTHPKRLLLGVKRTAHAAAIAKGTDEKTAAAFAANFSGHSLRAGLATSAAAAGVPERAIMAQTGHKRTDTLRKYIRLGSLFRENAAAQVGL